MAGSVISSAGTVSSEADCHAVVLAAVTLPVTFHDDVLVAESKDAKTMSPSAAPATDLPDQLRLDFDPAPGTGFTDAVRAACIAREVMDQWSWPSYAKTSGGRGVHVEFDGAPGYALTKHYPSLQRERVAVLGRAGYGIVHLRNGDLFEAGWLKSGAALEDFRRRLEAELDGHLLRQS